MGPQVLLPRFLGTAVQGPVGDDDDDDDANDDDDSD